MLEHQLHRFSLHTIPLHLLLSLQAALQPSPPTGILLSDVRCHCCLHCSVQFAAEPLPTLGCPGKGMEQVPLSLFPIAILAFPFCFCFVLFSVF